MDVIKCDIMYEITIYGRGGQGAVTTSELLAIAAFRDGKYSQAFPAFGAERRGAPVRAFCRIDDKFINLRTHIYNPTHLIILDPTLLNSINVTEGLSDNGIIIINSHEHYPDLEKKYKVYYTDATKLAVEILGRPIVNTAVLGAFAKKTGLVTLDSLKEAIKEKFGAKGEAIVSKNIELIQNVYEAVE